MEVVKSKRILALVGIICLFIATFLPYITFSLWGYSQSISLWGYWEGKIVLVLTLANALFIFKDWIEKYVPQLFNNNIGRLVEKANNPKFSLVPTILIAVFAIYMLISINVDSEYLKYGLGFYMLWIGVIALIGHAIFYKKQEQQVAQPQQSVQQFDQMQQPVQQFTQPQQPIPQVVQQNQPIQQQGPQITQPQQPVLHEGDLNKKYCPYCGNQVDSNATTCFICKSNF